MKTDTISTHPHLPFRIKEILGNALIVAVDDVSSQLKLVDERSEEAKIVQIPKVIRKGSNFDIKEDQFTQLKTTYQVWKALITQTLFYNQSTQSDNTKVEWADGSVSEFKEGFLKHHSNNVDGTVAYMNVDFNMVNGEAVFDLSKKFTVGIEDTLTGNSTEIWVHNLRHYNGLFINRKVFDKDKNKAIVVQYWGDRLKDRNRFAKEATIVGVGYVVNGDSNIFGLSELNPSEDRFKRILTDGFGEKHELQGWVKRRPGEKKSSSLRVRLDDQYENFALRIDDFEPIAQELEDLI